MDTNAFVQKYSSVAHYEADSVAASFIVALSIIDRTILPRTITFSSDVASLKLAVTERKAQILETSVTGKTGSKDGAADLVQQLAAICSRVPSQHIIQPLSSPNIHGYRISQLVNSQDQKQPSYPIDEVISHMIPNRFSFNQKGWPISMPEDAPVGSLDNAWRSNLWTRRWLENARKYCGPKILIITTSSDVRENIAVNASPSRTDFLPVNAHEIGQIIAAWKAGNDQ